MFPVQTVESTRLDDSRLTDRRSCCSERSARLSFFYYAESAWKPTPVVYFVFSPFETPGGNDSGSGHIHVVCLSHFIHLTLLIESMYRESTADTRFHVHSIFVILLWASNEPAAARPSTHGVLRGWDRPAALRWPDSVPGSRRRALLRSFTRYRGPVRSFAG